MPKKIKQDIRSPIMWCWGPNLGPVQEQSVLLLLNHLYTSPSNYFYLVKM